MKNFAKKIDYEKDGDLIVDINGIYDKISIKFNAEQEAPIPAEEAPNEPKEPEASPELVEKALLDAISKKLEEIS